MGEYEDRDIEELGEDYAKHVAAMTKEGLHSKSDIAAELAFRDREIDWWKSSFEAAHEIVHAGEYGPVCTITKALRDPKLNPDGFIQQNVREIAALRIERQYKAIQTAFASLNGVLPATKELANDA